MRLEINFICFKKKNCYCFIIFFPNKLVLFQFKFSAPITYCVIRCLMVVKYHFLANFRAPLAHSSSTHAKCFLME